MTLSQFIDVFGLGVFVGLGVAYLAMRAGFRAAMRGERP